MTGQAEALAAPAPTAPWLAGVRQRDWIAAAVVAAIYAMLWLFLPSEWAEFHSGGKWFLLVFVVTSGLGGLLASVVFSTPGLRFKDHSAVWLGIQVIFWNPISFRAIAAVVEAIGLPASASSVVALGGLLVFGLLTCLIGGVLSGSAAWKVAYACRAAQCFVTTWVPLLPPLAFLHVLAFVQAVTWERSSKLSRYAAALVALEQTLAFLWFFLFWEYRAL